MASEPHSRMSEATKIMIQESVIQGRVNSYTRGLLQENHQLQEVTEGLKIPVDPWRTGSRTWPRAVCSHRVPDSTCTGAVAGWRADGRLGIPLPHCLSLGCR